MIFKIKFICKIRNNLLHAFIRQHDEKQQTFSPHIRDLFFFLLVHTLSLHVKWICMIFLWTHSSVNYHLEAVSIYFS